MHTTLNFKDFRYFNGKIPIASKQARQLKKACETQAKMLEAKKNSKKEKLMKLWMSWMSQNLTIL